jgi:hypothetical protein
LYPSGPGELGSLCHRSLPPADLGTLARAFAHDVTALLNATVTHGVTFSAVVGGRPGTMILGRGVTKTSLDPQRVPLALSAKRPTAWLWVAFIIGLDPSSRYLAVMKSGFALYADEEGDQMMLHYDYEREPDHGYPAAHVQINGIAPQLSDLSERRSTLVPPHRKELKDFHFPVGGRRYRPTIEDVIEFLATEDLADCRAGWREAVDRSRQTWADRQLRAAVRRTPQPALEQLRQDGYIT